MDSSSLMNDGLTLMLFGMGFVFLFLTLLVGATTLMSRIITKYEKNVGMLPEDGVPSPTAVIPRHGPLATPHIGDKNLISVISAAVLKFRSRHK
jgi:oxaloacetate decarboxylase gamma subunit